MPKFECSICMEKFDVKKYFHCDKCQTDICKQCLKDSIITYGKTLPNCPNCHENISYALLAKIISKKFIQEDLFKHLTDIEFEVLNKEKIKLIANVLNILTISSRDDMIAYVTKFLHEHTKFLRDTELRSIRNPETRQYEDVEMPIKKTTSIYREIIMNNVDLLMNELKKNINDKTVLKNFNNRELSLESTISTNIREICQLLYIVMTKSEIEQIFQQYLGEYINKDLLIRDTITRCSDLKEMIKKELKQDKSKTIFIFRCTECEFGFIDKNYICNSCKKHFCSKCLKEKHENNCNTDDIKTAELIYKDTKPCPNCYTRIYKISGCNQMFCTYCKKGFDWRTGEIIENNFHNPHRMEWLRNGGNDALPDFACLDGYIIRYIDRFVSMHPNRYYLQNLNSYYNYINDQLNNTHRRKLNKLNDESEDLSLLVRYLFTKNNNNIQNKSDFRLSEDDFKSTLESRIKLRYYENIYVEIYDTLREILSSTLIRIDQILGYRYINSNFNLTNEEVQNINNLYNNCYIFLRDIEKNRMEELEIYLDMKFIKPVDFKNDLSIYAWNSKETGLKTFEEFYNIHQTLIQINNENIDLTKIYKTMDVGIYNKYTKRKIGKIFEYIKIHISNEQKTHALKNISKLNLTFEEKEFIYNLFTR